MGHYRYNVLSASINYGINEHPQKQMRNLGFELIYSEPAPIADCWIFKTTNEIDDLPGYINEIPAELVRHAHWKPSEDFPPYYICSGCENCYAHEACVKSGEWNYCPNCGAKMERVDTE